MRNTNPSPGVFPPRSRGGAKTSVLGCFWRCPELGGGGWGSQHPKTERNPRMGCRRGGQRLPWGGQGDARGFELPGKLDFITPVLWSQTRVNPRLERCVAGPDPPPPRRFPTAGEELP